MRVHVRQITYQAAGINSYELVHPDGEDLPEFTAGSHIDFFFRDGSVRQYSLCNNPKERHRYLIAVLREVAGRGGSQALHERVHVQRQVRIGAPRNHFRLEEEAKRHLLLAGGIGVTPIIAMAMRLRDIGADFMLHYCTKDATSTAFAREISELMQQGHAMLHHDGGDPRRGLDIEQLLKDYQEGTHLYYCGPAGFMRAAERATAHWPPGSVHFEYFAASASPKATITKEELGALGDESVGIGFQVKIASTGKSYFVPNNKSIVQVLAENGINVEVSCESGLCGTCTTRYLDGQVDHQDLVLDDNERANFLTLCCSRAKSNVLVLDL